ncbi:hypothetical protein EV561_102690 [Rhizobium sp. BK376]|nr:hypothetical protein EV561_102690 [Rhizobium sp. BK376]
MGSPKTIEYAGIAKAKFQSGDLRALYFDGVQCRMAVEDRKRRIAVYSNVDRSIPAQIFSHYAPCMHFYQLEREFGPPLSLFSLKRFAFLLRVRKLRNL